MAQEFSLMMLLGLTIAAAAFVVGAAWNERKFVFQRRVWLEETNACHELVEELLKEIENLRGQNRERPI